jgi:hypothetical protein
MASAGRTATKMSASGGRWDPAPSFPAVSSDEIDRNRAAAGEPYPTPPSSSSLRRSDLAGSCHPAHLLLITKIGSSKLPFVDSSRCTACLVSDMFEYKLLSFFVPKAAGQY